jgi:hypothetical protein
MITNINTTLNTNTTPQTQLPKHRTSQTTKPRQANKQDVHRQIRPLLLPAGHKRKPTLPALRPRRSEYVAIRPEVDANHVVCCGSHFGGCVDCPLLYSPSHIEYQNRSGVECPDCSARLGGERAGEAAATGTGMGTGPTLLEGDDTYVMVSAEREDAYMADSEDSEDDSETSGPSCVSSNTSCVSSGGSCVSGSESACKS